jgi:hypothetical protein
MNVSKTEEGALAYRTQWAVKKNVIWTTDRFGYRKANTLTGKHPIMIVGDSNIAGSGLSQDELLSEVLERRLGVSVYPLSPERLKTLNSNGLFMEHTPDIVILESIERSSHNPKAFSPLQSEDFQQPSRWSQFMTAAHQSSVLQKITIILDRAFKGNMLHYLRARINGAGPSISQNSVIPSCPVLFLHGSEVNRNTPVEQIEQIAKNLKDSSDVLSKRGIRFIFLPVPNKETIHYECLGTMRPVFIEHLVQRLRQLNVEVVDTQAAFEEVYKKRSTMLYHVDDDHWNAEGVKLTADLLEKQIRQNGISVKMTNP